MVHIQKVIMTNNLEISYWEGTEGCALWGNGLCIESFEIFYFYCGFVARIVVL